MEEKRETPRSLTTFRSWMGVVFSGVCMGITELIPGISGGTTAFIMGFWHDLLDSIKSFNVSAFKLLLSGRCRAFFSTVRWRFLLALGIGDVVALCFFAPMVAFFLGHETYRSYLYSCFLGLIAASILFCGMKISQWRISYVLGFVVAAAMAFSLTNMRWTSESHELLFDLYLPRDSIPNRIAMTNYDEEKQVLLAIPQSTLEAMLAKGLILSNSRVFNHAEGSWGSVENYVTQHRHHMLDWQLSLYGALAIVAMLLPGISGSYVLMILGKYALVVGALADFVTAAKGGVFEKDAFFVLLSLLIGLVVGALLFSRYVSALLNRYYNATMACLTGFMAGSLPALWPFWSFHYVLEPLKLDKGPHLVVDTPIWPGWDTSEVWLAIVICCAGVGVVFACEWIAQHKLTKLDLDQINSSA